MYPLYCKLLAWPRALVSFVFRDSREEDYLLQSIPHNAPNCAALDIYKCVGQDTNLSDDLRPYTIEGLSF